MAYSDPDNKCTGFFNGNWLNCCIAHDYAYADGGNLKNKIEADLKLFSCVSKKGHPVIGFIMFLGVSLFGAGRFRWIK